MSKVYVGEGDIVTVMRNGREFEFRVGVSHRIEGDIALTLDAVPRVILCEVCGENEAGDYETGGGQHICPTCVNSALAFKAIEYVLDNIGDYDVPLARTIAALDEEDAHMRSSGMSYVDSESSALDMMRGYGVNDRFDFMCPLFETIVGAFGDPGDMQGVAIQFRQT